MSRLLLQITLLSLLGLKGVSAEEVKPKSLTELRAEHETKLVKELKSEEAIDLPPADSPFDLVKIKAANGMMPAYLSKSDESPKGQKKGPAIVWLTGGLPPSGPGSYLWESTSADNEQSARIYRIQGIPMLFPVVRGMAKESPGNQEWFYGEVDDVICACQFLAKDPRVDPKRIYVGGHSGGGTLAMLVAASTDEVAGVIAFGPSENDYDRDGKPYQLDEKERNLRSPIRHLDRIRVPTYVIGGGDSGDMRAIAKMKKVNQNELVKFFEVLGADHFSVLHPANIVLADAILDSEDGVLKIGQKELGPCYQNYRQEVREIRDLEILATVRSQGVSFEEEQKVSFYVFADEEEEFTEEFYKVLKSAKFQFTEVEKFENSNGNSYYGVVATKHLDLGDLRNLFQATAAVEAAAEECELYYEDWGVE